MSLFIGKDINNNNVMHMSNTIKTIDELKSGIQDTTVFHSSLDYIEFTKVSCVNLGHSYYDDMYGSYDTWSIPTYLRGFTIVELPNLVVDKLSDGYLYLFVCDSNKIVPNVIQSISTTFPVIGMAKFFNDLAIPELISNPYSLYYGRYTNIPTYVYNRYVLSGDFSTIDIYVLNIKASGYVKNPNYNTTKGIVLSNSGIEVNGINIATYKYISKVKVNEIDIYANIGEVYLQFINSNDSNGNTSLNATDKFISIGNKQIFNSSLSLNSLFTSNIITVNLPSIHVNYSSPVDIDTGINIGINKLAIILNSTVNFIVGAGGFLFPDKSMGAGLNYLLYIPIYASIPMQTAELIYKSDGKLYYRTLSRTDGEHSYNISSRTITLLLFN